MNAIPLQHGDPLLGELDLHLIGEGRHERLWEVLGAHPRVVRTARGPVAGTTFAVWAPNARAVRVVGDFDRWADGVPMRRRDHGVWEVFVPGADVGARYRYRVRSADGGLHDHADPLAFAAERPPGTASVVHRSRHTWRDAAWLDRRRQVDPVAAPLSVYEVHLGSWLSEDERHAASYRVLAHRLADHVGRLGFTHVELMPVAEHPYGGSWGYQVTSYYAPTARYGDPDDFRYLVDHLHAHGIGVIVDWVPAHFPRDDWALAGFDGTPLYEHPDPRRGEHPDWGTYVFAHGRPQVRNFLVANALYWLEEFHVDGLRVDAVASMLYLDYSRGEGQWEPNEFGGRENLEAVALLRELTTAIRRHRPDALVIAEESTLWPGVTAPVESGGLGFDLKWNLGWMHDTLGYFGHDPVRRAGHHHELVLPATYAAEERWLLPLSHDEVVHGKGSLWSRMPGDDAAKAAGLRALLAWMWAHPGKKLLFMGGEFGQVREWAEAGGLDWGLLGDPAHAGVAHLVADLNRLLRTRPALHALDHDPAGFAWLDADDADRNVVAFLRRDPAGGAVVCVANLSGVALPDYRVGLPQPGRWRVVLDTDAAEYGGSTHGPRRAVTADGIPWQGLPVSATWEIPPNSVLLLEYDPGLH
ncbi:1,4-alpha-glucan branching protein GlgB [Actinosynnema sp. CS-041913]|uniref:1,4-alpha-glucan branching protein GlgB n=1 Tax=Actinosynnema sp. CS-041913 TaxID=3239917 RepID=UPI003D8A759E